MTALSRPSTFAAFVAAATFATVTTNAMAAKETMANSANLDPCIRSVSLIGAQLKHKEVERDDGSTAYEFIVRTSGADYRVVCDAKTGVLGDVTPVFGAAG